MHATLLVLAAGMGSRYGGLKQIDPVGPSGETVLDYAVFDAMRAELSDDLPVHGDPPFANHRLRLSSRREAGVGNDLLQSLELHHS